MVCPSWLSDPSCGSKSWLAYLLGEGPVVCKVALSAICFSILLNEFVTVFIALVWRSPNLAAVHSSDREEEETMKMRNVTKEMERGGSVTAGLDWRDCSRS